MQLTRRQFTAALAAAGAAPSVFAADSLKIGYVSPQTGWHPSARPTSG